MFELLPIVGGLGAGFVIGRHFVGRLRWLAVVVAGAIVGALVALVSGELAESLGYLLVDVPLGVVSAGVGAVLAAARQGTASRPAR
ncbi:MAG TPA: hypothetical protein VGW10_17945 [Solirubrobacteraceae bacterium]|nr:hypothetical protein [Solirubrobacteraceae bacterium]